MTISTERQALLDKKADEYIASMEAADGGINYTRVDTERLLVLEAINDWSGRALAEGGEIKLSYGCADPCCATAEECTTLAKLMQKSPAILYPVSGLTLSDKDELRFSFMGSTYRMLPHADGSRADGIGIAECRHIGNVDAAIDLWVDCAREDCMAYLFHQMDLHGLYLEEEERSSARGIITSAIQDRFSPGQIWNAMWRSVKDAAALSTRQYYTSTKAAKTIPKKIDKVLTQAAASSAPFDAYERIAAMPMGAVLTLFLHRFGITDSTPGAQVRAKLKADAALASPEEVEEECDEDRGLVVGAFYFLHKITPLDRMTLSCFGSIRLDSHELSWSKKYETMGRIDFTLKSIYAFDGNAFGEGLLQMLGVAPPTEEDIARHAATAAEESARGNEYIDTSGRRAAFEEVLIKAGILPQLASRIHGIVRYPADPAEIVDIVRQLPLPTGLVGVRTDSAHIYGGEFIVSGRRIHLDSAAAAAVNVVVA